MSMNSISLVGNLTREPEQITFASGRNKTVFVVAVNGPPKKEGEQETADFYRVDVWGKLAELAAKYLSKGCQVGVTGRLTLEQWTDREGKERVTPTVNATQISFPPKSDRQREAQVAAKSTSDDLNDIFAGTDEMPF